MTYRPRALLLLSVVSLVACGTTSNPASIVRPSMPTLAGACSPSDDARPLIVEQDVASRARIEALTHEGLVAVRYSGCNMQVLPACKVESHYAWTGVSPKREEIVMSNADELHAQVPLGAFQLEGKVAGDSELVADLTVAGRYRAPVSAVREDELVGDCAGATHFVSAYAVGAFRFSSRAKGSGDANARVLAASAGGASSSSNELLNEDGDPKACGADLTVGPPASCSSIVRLELTKLSPGVICPPKAKWNGSACTWSPACAVGQEPVYGTCASGGVHLDIPISCSTGDTDECKRECASGAKEACAEASRRLMTTDPATAMRLSERGCNLGSLASCNNLAIGDELGLGGLPKDFDKAIALLDRGCKAGLGLSCSNEASAWIRKESSPSDDERMRASVLAKHGCELGSASGCAIAFLLLPADKTKQAIDATGVALIERGCSLGHPDMCAEITAYALNGWGMPKDRARAVGAAQSSCDAGSPMGCEMLAMLYKFGDGGAAKDSSRALDLFRRACAGNKFDACHEAATLLRSGEVTRDDTLAATLDARACEKGINAACTR